MTEELSVQVARVEAKVDTTLTRLNEVAEMHRSQLADHEARLRLLERTHDQVNPLQARKDIDDLEDRVDSIENERKTVGGLIRSSGSVVGWIAGIVVAIFTLIDYFKSWHN